MDDTEFIVEALREYLRLAAYLVSDIPIYWFWLCVTANTKWMIDHWFINGEVKELFKCLLIYAVLSLRFIERPDRNTTTGRPMGKLNRTDNEIAKGANGTVVYEGTYEYEFDGRIEIQEVAVKRLVKAHTSTDYKEVRNLIATDGHPYTARFFGVQEDDDFVYIILERCICNLYDLVHMFSGKNSGAQDSNYIVRMGKVKNAIQGTKLWEGNNNETPSHTLIKLMRDMAVGLAHLHLIGMVHRDLKPENMLIINKPGLCLKLSDMGLSKRLPPGMVSLGPLATGFGTPGWQPQEVLCGGSQTMAVDLFSLGCVYYFCITAGELPFGDTHAERDHNIRSANEADLSSLDKQPEAKELISCLLNHVPTHRPTAEVVLAHPLFWDDGNRLAFLGETKVKLDGEPRNSQLFIDLNSRLTSSIVLNGRREWIDALDSDLRTLVWKENLGRINYKFKSVTDLVRLIRNKYVHFDDFPDDIKKLLGSTTPPQGNQGKLEVNPEAYYNYFASLFPNLLIEVYKVMKRHCENDKNFARFFKKLSTSI
ncbi:OLC1v1016830C1 [Oldenlandia corymbosa var. corymbosa]|uniref:OLC1v1016830C1 n=1 Tax=Oldenlandia corymbosa var. corymbosa TaxID=529605 RepID=A0AAV1E823_OLDCO|nr:OLC1v1016830C1 [Oldenlandia corymbosa var. corymbosa]